MPTLHWLLQESGLHNIRLMTGKSQLMHPIVSVNVLDNPDVIKWFKQDELILTTGYVFKNHPELMPRILRDLKSCGCTALGIKVPRFFRQIPAEMLAEAKALDFPLLELPFFYGFSEIMHQDIAFFPSACYRNACTIKYECYVAPDFMRCHRSHRRDTSFPLAQN